MSEFAHPEFMPSASGSAKLHLQKSGFPGNTGQRGRRVLISALRGSGILSHPILLPTWADLPIRRPQVRLEIGFQRSSRALCEIQNGFALAVHGTAPSR